MKETHKHIIRKCKCIHLHFASSIAWFMLTAGILFSGLLGANAQPVVDIGIFPKGTDTLEVRMMPKGTFNGVVSNIVFTLRWESGCGSSLGNVVQTGTPAAYIPMAKSGSEKISGGYTYQVF